MCFLLNAQICERLFHRKYLGKATFVPVFNLAVIFTLPVLEPFFTIPFLLTVAISLLLLVQVKLDGLRIGRAYMYGLL